MEYEFSTGNLYDFVARSESIDEYKKILESLADQKKSWTQIIGQIVKDNNYSANQLAKLCGVSRQAAQKWMDGAIPKSRDTYIKIGFAAHYNIEEMNHFLQRYGCCDKLYPKNLEDSVYIFVLTSDEMEHTYATCKSIIEMIKAEIEVDSAEEQNMNYETSAISHELMNVKSLPQMLEFVQQKAFIFKKQYYHFYDYVEKFIQKNLLMDEGAGDSVFLLANSQQWSSSLRQCVSEISKKKWYPQRNKIISLGIHLNMDVDQINEMLELAQMEKLCAKIPFENAIIYALENAKLEDLIYCDGTDDLCRYVKKILVSLDFEGLEFFLEELPKDEEIF